MCCAVRASEAALECLQGSGGICQESAPVSVFSKLPETRPISQRHGLPLHASNTSPTPLLNLPHDTPAGGVAYLDYIRQLAQRLDSDWEGVQADLEAIR